MLDEKLKDVVCRTLKITADRYNDDLAAGDIPEWDSLGHVNLITAVENEFNVAFDVGDVIEVETIADLSDLVRRYSEAAPPSA